MKKNILINEAQESFILEAMQHNDALSNLPKHLLNDMNSRNGLSISDCEFFYSPILKRYLEHAIIKRFDEITKYFLDDISNVDKNELSNKIEKLMSKILQKEKAIRPQLESLCYNVLTELFDIPEDSFTYECHLLESLDDNRSVQVHPEPINYDETEFSEYNEADLLSREIQKRRLMNLLCIGGSTIVSMGNMVRALDCVLVVLCVFMKRREIYILVKFLS